MARKRKALDGYVTGRSHYVVNQKAPKFDDSRTKRLRTRGAQKRAALAEA